MRARSCAWPTSAGLALVAIAACATTPGPAPAPAAAAAVVSIVEVPPAPARADEAVRASWAAMLAGASATALPPASATSAAGAALDGYRALLSGNVAAAQAAFGRALATAPDLAEGAYGMGLVAEAQGQHAVAQRWFAEALRLDPALSRAEVANRRLELRATTPLLAAAEAAAAAGDVASATSRYREASEQVPWLAAPYLQLSALQWQAGDTSGAIATLEVGRRRTGDALAVVERLAIAYGDADMWAEAAEAWQRLADLRPGDAAAAERATAARRRFEEASLPPQYRELIDKPVITREELAAVLAIHLQGLRPPADRREGVIIADAGERWSSPFVYRLVSWGVMDIYQNNTFWPDMEVRRSMLVESAWRVLELVGAADSAPRARIDDPPAQHLLFRPVQAVVGLDLMSAPGGTFDLLAPVSGREAIEVAERLAALVRERQQ